MAFVLMPDTPRDWLANVRTVGSVVVWIAVLAGALAALSKFSLRDVPGGRKLWKLYRYLFADPLHRHRVANLTDAMKPALDEMKTDVLNEIAELRTENSREHKESWQRLDSLEQRTAVIEATTTVHATLIDRGASQQAQLVAQNAAVVAALDALKAEIAALRTTTEEANHAQ